MDLKNSICIKSDFNDFYDNLNNSESELVYNRYLKDCKQRGTALKHLRSLNIKTIDIKPVNQFLPSDGMIVVYTDPKGHNGTGKKIMKVEDALSLYNNCAASKYYKTKNNLFCKFLQIGKRRFTLWIQQENEYQLTTGKLMSITESENSYNRLIGLPIFSIDYITNDESGMEMIATDFNEVQNLSLLHINEYLSDEEIINEIKESIIVYNLVDKK